MASISEYDQSFMLSAALFDESLVEFVDPLADLQLLKAHKDSTLLDVAVTDEGMKLIVHNKKGAEDKARSARLSEYLSSAYIKVPDSLTSEQGKQFYTGLRKWKQFNPIQMSDRVQRTLSPQINLAYKALETAKIRLKTIPNKENHRCRNIEREIQQRNYELRLSKAKLAMEIGLKPEPAGKGVNGAKRVFGFDGTTLLIMKTEKDDKRPFFMTEKILFERTQPEVCANDPRQAGAVAFIASDFFGFDIVPRTETDENGFSFQDFVDGSVEADKALVGPEKTLLKNRSSKSFTDQELELLQLKAIFNYVTGDLDGKDDKLRLKLADNGSIIEIAETDNDNSFPQYRLTQADGQIIKKNEWKDHKWAEIPFQPKRPRISAVLKKLFNEREVDAFLHYTLQKYPNFWTAQRALLLKERIAVIKVCIDLGYSPMCLGSIYGLEFLDMKDFAKEKQLVEEVLSGGMSQASASERPHPRAAAYAQRFAVDDEKE